MRHIGKLFALVLLCLIFTPKTKGAHIAGANFEYTCIGPDTWLITLVLWRDCNAATQAPINPQVSFTNSCGTAFNVNFQLLPAPNQNREISDVCSALAGQTTCGNGTVPGMEMYKYQATVNFPSSCNGEISVLAIGGGGGFSYLWPNGKTGPTQDSLCAGRYVVTVTDNNGCTGSDTIAIFDASNLDMTTTKTPVSCTGQCDGSITVVPSGGVPPYTYAWSNNHNLATQNNLCPGLYTITVMDDNGNQFREYVTIDNPAPLTIGFTTLDETCNGSCDGMVRANVAGGTEPYIYTWTGGLTGATNGSVCAGTYDLTITDANNCLQTATVNVGGPAPLTATISVPNSISCFDVCDGELLVSTIGGTAPYTYAWNTKEDTTHIYGLCAGNYQVTVTDATGCSQVASTNLSQPVGMTINSNVLQPSCGACNGALYVATSGAPSTFSYNWGALTAANTDTVTNVCAGVYSVIVSDTFGCSQTVYISLSDVNASATETITAPSCNGVCDASIDVVPSYGTAPYSYVWSSGQSTATISGLCAGRYAVTITDAGGCKYANSYEVIDPDTISVTAQLTSPTCNNSCDGSITITPAGGANGYSYLWSNGTTTVNPTGLCAGTYTVTITDANGCVGVESFVLVNPATLGLTLFINNSPVCTGRL